MRSFSPTKYSEKYHFASKYYGRMGSSPSLSTQASGYISRPQSSSPFKRIGPNPSRLHIAVNNIKEEQPDATSKSSNKTESRISEMPLSEAVMLCPKEIQDNEVEISENSNINYFWKRAAKYRHRGNFFDALKCYKKVLSFEPNHFESLVMVGICNLKLGLITEAILTYDQAIKINDKSFIPYFNKALAHIYLQQYSEAVKCMNVAGHSISNQNEIPQELFKLRALALYRSGKIASALDDMKRKNSYSKLKVSNNGQSFVESELSTHEKTFSVIRNRSQKRKSINKSFDQVFETNNN